MKFRRDIIFLMILLLFIFISSSSFYTSQSQADRSIVYDVFVDNDIAYISYGSEGLHIVDVSDKRKPTLISVYDFPGDIVDMFKLNQFVYALFANSSLQIINVTDIENPTLEGSLPLPYPTYNVVVDTYNTVYVAAGENGLKIINVTDTSSPYVMETYDSIGEVKAVKIKNNIAYVADGHNGLLILDIIVRENPTLLNRIDTGFCENIFVGDFYTYLACGSYGLKIFDLTNTSNPIQVGSFWTSYKISSVAVEYNDLAYVADGFGGLKIIDVGTPSIPVMLGHLDTSNTARSVFVSGNYVFIANTENLLVVDVSIPSSPVIRSSYPSEDGSIITPHEPIEPTTIILIITSTIAGIALIILLARLGPFIRMIKTWKEDPGPFTNSLAISSYFVISGFFLWMSYNAFLNGNESLMNGMLFASPILGGLICGIFVFKKDWIAVILPLSLLLSIGIFCILLLLFGKLFGASFFSSIGVLFVSLICSAIGRAINQAIIKEEKEKPTSSETRNIVCSKCGETIPSSSKFCYNCGHIIEK